MYYYSIEKPIPPENMETNDSNRKKDVDLGKKKWNNQQDSEAKKETEETLSKAVLEHLNSENEIDEKGNTKIVHRARPTSEVVDENSISKNTLHEKTGNEAIENEKSLENKDRNYDTNPNRYPNSHPDNQQNRGNIKLDDQ